MDGYRNIAVFVDEEKMTGLEEKLEEANISLDAFVNSFLIYIIEEPKYQYEKYLSGSARSYYKAITGKEWV